MGKKRTIKNLTAIAVVTPVVSAFLVLSGCVATETSTEAETHPENILPGAISVTIHQART
ncbi:MAG: hypothetical protein V3R96_08275 [Dehalococcoidales bacterium]